MKINKHLFLAVAAVSFFQLSARTIYVTRHAQVGTVIKEIKETKITEDLGVIQAQKLANHLVNKLKFNVVAVLIGEGHQFGLVLKQIVGITHGYSSSSSSLRMVKISSRVFSSSSSSTG